MPLGSKINNRNETEHVINFKHGHRIPCIYIETSKELIYIISIFQEF